MGGVRALAGSHRALAAALVALLVVLLVVGVLSAVGRVGQLRWEARCQVSGGSVVLVPEPEPNPLLVQTSDPRQQCVTSDGRVLSSRQ